MHWDSRVSMYRQSLVKIPPIQNTSSNNTLHIYLLIIVTSKYTTQINHHFALAYLQGPTMLPFIRLAGLEPSMYASVSPEINFNSGETCSGMN